MLSPEMIINAEMVSAGIVVDRMGYMTKVCFSLYNELTEWLSFWDSWNDNDEFKHWITDDGMQFIREHTLKQYSWSKSMLTSAKAQLSKNMKGNLHYVLCNDERLWNKRGVAAMLANIDSEVITIINTLDYVSSMYDDYVEGLDMYDM